MLCTPLFNVAQGSCGKTQIIGRHLSLSTEAAPDQPDGASDADSYASGAVIQMQKDSWILACRFPYQPSRVRLLSRAHGTFLDTLVFCPLLQYKARLLRKTISRTHGSKPWLSRQCRWSNCQRPHLCILHGTVVKVLFSNITLATEFSPNRGHTPS